ncbi:MAG: GerMN domain-containing protein [bacterium]|jgi:germination protein M
MRRLISLLLIGLLLTLGGGCGLPGIDREPPDNNGAPVDPNPPQEQVTLTLYFGDTNAEYLIKEEREVEKGAEPYETLLLNELIKGPQAQGLVKTVPPETKLTEIRVVEGTAFVNFSSEFQTKHWGGSAGELLTIYSVVNTLTEVPGINQVQFLIEGDKLDSLAGHMDIQEPLTRDENFIKE